MGQEKHIMPGVYNHNKSGKRYLVLGTSLHTESGVLEVIYKPLYECEHPFFHRPLDMFLETHEVEGKQVKRFSLVKENHRVYTPMDMQKISLKENEIVVVNLPARLAATTEMSQALQEGMKETFPYNEVVILSNGVSIKTVEKE